MQPRNGLAQGSVLLHGGVYVHTRVYTHTHTHTRSVPEQCFSNITVLMHLVETDSDSEVRRGA